MRLLSGDTKIFELKRFFGEAQSEAQRATCQIRKCGAVLVKEREVIGRGFNSPPGNLESQRRCEIDGSSLHKKVTDTTCCVHAERRAISNAQKRGHDVKGAIMYFTSVNEDGERLLSGNPYCTDCSKMALDEGVEAWILEHESGFVLYNSEEYNEESFNYGI